MLKNVLKRIFLVDLLKGMWVTFYYQHPKNIYTEQYPLERPMVAERYRGAPRLNINPENGETLCIACNLCALACPETLIVVSTDLSHYLPYEAARETDGRTVEAILALDGEPVGDAEACGSASVRGLILAARTHRLRPQLLDLRNSGDTAGGRGEVVGYAAMAFEEPLHD